MKIIFTFITALALGGLITVELAWGDDAIEIADLQARIATLEATMMAPSGGGDAESLTSLRKNGTVRIGGDFEIGVMRSSVDKATENASAGEQSGYASAGKPPNAARSVSSGFYDADLNIRVDAGPDTYLAIKLDLDDTGSDGDLVEEAIFVWKNVRGSNWSVLFGKDEVFFGQDKSKSICELYNHGDVSYLADHTNLGGLVGQGEVDNTIHLGLQYKFQDLIKAEFSFFQNRGTSGEVYGIHNDQPEDNGLQSYAARLWLNPVEGLKLETSFINRHNGSEGINIPATVSASTQYKTEDIMALSFGAEFKVNNLELYGEYIHTWNADYMEDLSVDVVTCGIAYDVTDNIELYLEGGWSGTENETNRYLNEFNEDLFMGIIGAGYTFENGIVIQGEYVREWFSNDAADSVGLGDIDSAQANVVNFQVGWKF